MNKAIYSIILLVHMATHSVYAQVESINQQTNSLLQNGFYMAQAEKPSGRTKALIAMSLYDYLIHPTRLIDTSIISYSNSRNSLFNFNNLEYNTYHSIYFSNSIFGLPNSSEVSFDTIKHSPHGASPFVVSNYRRYDGSGNLILDDYYGQERTHFTYDANGLLIMRLCFGMNRSMTLDSFTRHYYFYNANNHLIKDSQEYYIYNYTTGSLSWQPYLTTNYTVNIAGYATQADFIYYGNRGYSYYAQIIKNTFNTSNLLVNSVIIRPKAGNTRADTLYQTRVSYNGPMRSGIFTDVWDTAIKAFVPSRYEFRRINGAGLPDSIWAGTYRIKPFKDTAITVILYDIDGYPISKSNRALDGTTEHNERFYYYITPTDVNTAVRASDIILYPNPAENAIHIDGLDKCYYHIIDFAGRMQQSGTAEGTLCRIPIAALSAGAYIILLQNREGNYVTKSFVKK